MTPILTQHSVINIALPLSDAVLLYQLLANSSAASSEDRGFTREEADQLMRLYHRTKEQLQKLSA